MPTLRSCLKSFLFEILYPAKSHFILLFDLSRQEQNNWKLLERLNQTFFYRCSAFPSFFIKTKIKPHPSIYHAKFNKYVKFIKIHRDVRKTWNTALFFLQRNVHREATLAAWHWVSMGCHILWFCKRFL